MSKSTKAVIAFLLYNAITIAAGLIELEWSLILFLIEAIFFTAIAVKAAMED